MSITSKTAAQPFRGGFVLLHREVFEHQIFDPSPFSQREAWIWLITTAAWKPTTITVGKRLLQLERGQLVFSLRFLAAKWKWGSHMAVKRYLDTLKAVTMIDTETVHGLLQVTICNYDKYQSLCYANGYTNGTEIPEIRYKEELNLDNTINKKKEDIPPTAVVYEFERGKVRITAHDLRRWENTFTEINVRAEIEAAYEWAATQSNWFMALTGILGKRNRDAIDRQKAIKIGIEAGQRKVVTGGGYA